MEHKEKQVYEAPTLKEVSFRVERGFATSNLDLKGKEIEATEAYRNYAGEEMTEETGWENGWN